MSPNYDYRRNVALSEHLVMVEGQAGQAVSIVPILDQGCWNLRGKIAHADFTAAVASGLSGLTLPAKVGETTEADGLQAICVGPDEWILLTQARETTLALPQDAPHHSLVNWSDQMATLEVSGPKAVDLLTKCIPLDLHPSAFKPGDAVRTLAAKAGVIFRQLDDSPRYQLILRRSFGDYLWAWLQDAAIEYR